MVFRKVRAVEVEGCWGCVGDRVRIAWVRTICGFRSVGESVPIIIGIEMVFRTVAVEVLDLVEQGDGEVALERGVMLVGYPNADGVRGVCLVVEGAGGSERTCGRQKGGVGGGVRVGCGC